MLDSTNGLGLMFLWLVAIVEGVITICAIYQVYLVVKRYKAAERTGEQTPMDILGEALTPLLGKGIVRKLVLTEMSVNYYGLIAWFKKPQFGDRKVFTYHRDSLVKTLTIVFMVLETIEIVGVHFMLIGMNEVLAWVTFVLGLYGMFYVIGIVHSFWHLPHLITEQYLHVRFGFLSSAVVNFTNIESITKPKVRDLWDKVPKNVFKAHVFSDTPQWEIRLKQPIKMRRAYGWDRDISAILLFMDDPKDFAAELQAKVDEYDGVRG